MTDLYRKAGGPPQALPDLDFDDQGQAWSDLAISEEARAATGWSAAPVRPDFLPTQELVWDEANQDWNVVDRAPMAPTVPEEVWAYQAKIVMAMTTLGVLGIDAERLGLTANNSLWDAVQAGVAAMDEQPRLVATIQLDSAPGFRRDAALLEILAPQLGLTTEAIDALFVAAAAIP